MVDYAHQLCWISNTYYLPKGRAPLLEHEPREKVLIYYQVSEPSFYSPRNPVFDALSVSLSVCLSLYYPCILVDSYCVS